MVPFGRVVSELEDFQWFSLVNNLKLKINYVLFNWAMARTPSEQHRQVFSRCLSCPSLGASRVSPDAGTGRREVTLALPELEYWTWPEPGQPTDQAPSCQLESSLYTRRGQK